MVANSNDSTRRQRKVFGLGLSRTGTTSLCRALTTLGFRCKHYPYDARTQAELWSGRRLSILVHYDAITDISIVPFYQALDRLYPGSRFIVTVRDEKRWIDSMQRHMERLRTTPMLEDLQFRTFTEAICKRVYGGITVDAETLVSKSRQHVAAVESYFADRPHDLLTVNIADGDGWEKLCPFLGVPVPDSDFPNVNIGRKDRAAWNRKVTTFLSLLGDVDSNPAKTILLDDGNLGVYVRSDERPIPFPARNGQFGGHPKSDAHACQLFQEALANRMETLVVAWPAFWWLETYPDFVRLLHDRSSVIVENDSAVVFDLRRPAPSHTQGTGEGIIGRIE